MSVGNSAMGCDIEELLDLILCLLETSRSMCFTNGNMPGLNHIENKIEKNGRLSVVRVREILALQV